MEDGPLTPQQAWKEGLGTRLAAQVFKLKERGHRIYTENVTNGGVTYARYHLTGEKHG